MVAFKPSNIVLAGVGALFVALAVGLVITSLVRPELETFVPTPEQPLEVGESSIGPAHYTVDARAHDEWVYFDFSRASVVPVEDRSSMEWDLAFQRHRMLTNGGGTNSLGQGGVLDLGPQSMNLAFEVPGEGYSTDQRRGGAARNRVLERWYNYSWTSHLLSPAGSTYAIRTADGKYAVVTFLGYYCPGGRPGCVTFSFRYRGDGGRRFDAVD